MVWSDILRLRIMFVAVSLLAATCGVCEAAELAGGCYEVGGWSVGDGDRLRVIGSWVMTKVR